MKKRSIDGRVVVVVVIAVLFYVAALVPQVVSHAKASAVSNPAVLVRGFAGSATDTAVSVSIASTSGIKLGPTRSVLICNDDDPTEGGGAEDLWVNFAGTASDPGSTFTESSTFAVKAGEKVNIDVEANRVSIRVNNAGQTANARIIASY